MRHIIPISGKDSLATAIWQTAHEPNIPYEYVYNDTLAELPESYAWLDRVESTLGIKIHRIGKSLEALISEQGMLPSSRVRFCTRLSKIKPMDQFIGKEKAIVYFGLRADEPERVGGFQTKTLTPKYPLREAGIGLATVYFLVGKSGLLPPAFFWGRLYDEVTRQLGTSTIEQWTQWQRDRAFAWRSRPNCFFCFFQRQYEWVGLLEHHPELFDRSEAIELGQQDRRESAYYWISQDWPLARIREKAETIFARRAEAVCRLIDSTRQIDLFQDGLDEMELSGTSCGLLCGK